MLMPADMSLFFDSCVDSRGIRQAATLEIVCMDYGGDEEMALVVYEGDAQIYDSGKVLTVVYRRNKNEAGAIENRIIDSDDLDKEVALYEALEEVIPTSIPFFYLSGTRVVLKTVEGKLTATITEEETVSYLPIPPHLSHIPIVPISELRKVVGLDEGVHRVKWKDQTFAFKRSGEYLEGDENLEGTIHELTILNRLRDSPNIIDLKAIVVNQDNCIRGFLMPFMYAGTLDRVFAKVRQNLGLSTCDDEAAFDWSLKLIWSHQITQGVVNLHAIDAYNGDLKPQNIVLGPMGQAILIDFLPVGFSDEFVAPEVLARHHEPGTTFESVLNGPADIYSLGLIFSALVQEKGEGVRVPLWREGSAPCWYRDIVQRCIHLDPAARPSAVDVLSLLQPEGSELQVSV